MPAPSVGRVVHYYADAEDGPYPALIVDASWGDPGHVSLVVFGFLKDEPAVIVRDVPERPLEYKYGQCWTWPPRVG